MWPGTDRQKGVKLVAAGRHAFLLGFETRLENQGLPGEQARNPGPRNPRMSGACLPTRAVLTSCSGAHSGVPPDFADETRVPRSRR